MKHQNLITAEQLYHSFNDPKLLILDASPESNVSNLVPKYTDEQIKGAIHFDVENVFSDPESHLPHTMLNPVAFESACRELGINQDSSIVIYDNLGVYTSPRAWWMFKTMGHEKVAVLNGGLASWKESGFPCEPRQSNTRPIGDFKTHFQRGLIKNADDIIERLETGNQVILDARSSGRFCGTAPEPRPGLKGGHIPGSYNLPFTEVLEDGKILSKDELAKKFSTFPAEDKPMIFSCGSGLTACIIMLAADVVLDNEMAIYDGSWAEWGQLDKVPVAT